MQFLLQLLNSVTVAQKPPERIRKQRGMAGSPKTLWMDTKFPMISMCHKFLFVFDFFFQPFKNVKTIFSSWDQI